MKKFLIKIFLLHYENRDVGNDFYKDELAPENIEAHVNLVLPQLRRNHRGPVGNRVRLKNK